MSAAQWRRAMNTQMPRAQVSVVTQAPARSAMPVTANSPAQTTAEQAGWWGRAWSQVRFRHCVVLLALFIYPMVASPFFTYQIAAQSMALGLIALS